MKNKKQTAIEWIKKELEGYGSPSSLNVDWETLDKLIEQAKQMEKDQIISAACYEPFLGDLPKWEGESYYEDKYGNKNG